MSFREFFTWDSAWRFRYQILGVVLLALGLATTINLAANASSKDPPDASQSALYVLVAGVFNVGGVWVSSRRPGAANLVASKMALRHLVAIARESARAKKRAETAFEQSDADAVHSALGHLSVQLSSIEQSLGSNLEDWVQAYPDLAPEKVELSEGEDLETEAEHG